MIVSLIHSRSFTEWRKKKENIAVGDGAAAEITACVLQWTDSSLCV